MADQSQASQSANRDEMDLLITRLVDGEASDEDHCTFTSHAERSPVLWRELAKRQLEMTMLGRAAERELQRATRVELPDNSECRDPVAPSATVRLANADGTSSPRRDTSRTRLLPWTGWAAAALLVIWIGVLSFKPIEQDEEHPAPVPAHAEVDPEQMRDAQQWLRLYLDVPYVLGELDPILLETRELDNGRIELRFVRRIEEILILEADDALPLDEQGRLKLDPEQLRQSSNHDG